ncbi:MAG: glycosyltransferase family 4 protein [Bacteroidia bacterium]|nr:glycosyltransferase family 4 protein [Bacteroidia bacterium]
MKVIYVYRSPGADKKNLIVDPQIDSIERLGIQVIKCPILKAGIKGYFGSIKRLKKILKSDKYNLIHAHYGLCGIISYLAKKREKLIVSFMGDDILGTNKSDGSYTYIGKLLVKINIGFAKKRYDYVIMKTIQMKNKSHINEKVAVIPNGVDIETFYPIIMEEARKSLNLPENKKIIIFVANPTSPVKNFSLLKNAVKFLNNPKIQIITLTNVSQATLNLFYNAANVLVLTSFHEGSPNVIKEAMACNCPIVSTDVGDVKQLISGIEGCYISSYNHVDLANKINLAISFSKRTQGRNYLIKLGLDSKTIAKKITEIYAMIIQPK